MVTTYDVRWDWWIRRRRGLHQIASKLSPKYRKYSSFSYTTPPLLDGTKGATSPPTHPTPLFLEQVRAPRSSPPSLFKHLWSDHWTRIHLSVVLLWRALFSCNSNQNVANADHSVARAKQTLSVLEQWIFTSIMSLPQHVWVGQFGLDVIGVLTAQKSNHVYLRKKPCDRISFEQETQIPTILRHFKLYYLIRIFYLVIYISYRFVLKFSMKY